MGWLLKDFSLYSSENILYLSCMQASIFFLVFQIYLKYVPVKPFSFRGKDDKSVSYWFIFILYIGVQVAFSIFIRFFEIDVEQFEFLNKDLLLRNPAPFYFATIILAPFYEEYIFRGVILGTLTNYAEQYMPGNKIFRFWLPLVFSSALFATMHGEIDVFPFIFCLGILLGWLALKTGGIKKSIIVHMINNLIASISFLHLKFDSLIEVQKNSSNSWPGGGGLPSDVFDLFFLVLSYF